MFFGVLGVGARQAARVGFRPLRIKSHSSPLIREVKVDEKRAEDILPIVVFNEEGAIIFRLCYVELLLWM